MSYAAVSDLIMRMSEREIVQLTNPNIAGASAVNEAVANAAIADGTGLIDSYLGQRVDLPLTSVPQLVSTLTVDLAIYYLHTKIGNSNTTDSPVQKLYDDAIKHLERFARGETSLGLHIPPGEEPINNVEIDSEDRQFTRTKMGGLT